MLNKKLTETLHRLRQSNPIIDGLLTFSEQGHCTREEALVMALDGLNDLASERIDDLVAKETVRLLKDGSEVNFTEFTLNIKPQEFSASELPRRPSTLSDLRPFGDR